jgi:hypothetical protein
MSRSDWALIFLAGVALAATGCAHCDTCDNLPMPCASGDCGMGAVAAPAVIAGPAMMAPTIATIPAPAPAVIRSQPAGSGASGSGSSIPAPLPPSPGVQAPPFSPGASNGR